MPVPWPFACACVEYDATGRSRGGPASAAAPSRYYALLPLTGRRYYTVVQCSKYYARRIITRLTPVVVVAALSQVGWMRAYTCVPRVGVQRLPAYYICLVNTHWLPALTALPVNQIGTSTTSTNMKTHGMRHVHNQELAHHALPLKGSRGVVML